MADSALSGYPHGLRIIAEAAGIDAAMKLAMARGGARIAIPHNAAGSTLAGIVGTPAAEAIAAELAGVRIDVPLARKLVFGWLRRQGESQESCAARLGISRRTAQAWDRQGEGAA